MSGRTERTRARPLLLRTGVAVLGLLVLLAAGTTGAAHTDGARLGLGGAGIGPSERFDIGLVSQGRALQADLPSGAPWAVPGAGELVPGRTITTELPVFNNTPRLLADTAIAIVAREGGTGDGVPDITPFLRFTATLASGAVLFEDAVLADASGSLGALAPRGAPPLDGGEAFTPGEPGSLDTITLSIEYLDEPGVEALNGGQSALSLRFDAGSVTS
ncbi:hypothetical protein [Arenivirga flava]|uniref:Uncharacterized protein n=1 Tax=Arenivirga flava TaxID=1930060 RepID=A0AA37UHL3_9MICO|nr:hypothetical protein [Arenivirga flava]GMA29089.1 hypothetical protein GCM10025874_23420 [Arenivirga flava]